MIIMTHLLFSCGQHSESAKNETVQPQNEETKPNKKETNIPDWPAIGEKIQGDFNGDGLIDIATVVLVKEGQGNPVEEGTPDEYQIQFSGNILKPINAGCCEILLVNEKDLNNDGTDEISIYQAPSNGCTYTLTTYSFTKEAWKQTVEPLLIPTGCDPVSNEDIQNRVFNENNDIYYYETDLNVENGGLVKRKAIPK